MVRFPPRLNYAVPPRKWSAKGESGSEKERTRRLMVMGLEKTEDSEKRKGG
jgi:hypothetical protein